MAYHRPVMSKSPHDTPAMRQFHRFKKQHPDCVLLFRMGDFYEMFYDDAEAVAKAIGLTLTQRTEGIPMAGVPYHAIDGYLRRMLAAGFRVAICEQMEDPAQAKGVVRRDVTRLITPGTLTDDSLLDESRENPLAAVAFADDDHASLAFAELSTGTFHVAQMHATALRDEIGRIAPSELLYVETADRVAPPRVAEMINGTDCALTPRPAWQFRLTDAIDLLKKQFQVTTLSGYGFDDDDASLGPAGAVVAYLLETQKTENDRLPHLLPPRRYAQADHLVIDQTSLRALEVERTMRSGAVADSLLGTLQDCRTAMGKRLLRQWLCYPLCDRVAIEQRQHVVAAIVDDSAFSEALVERLNDVQDVQRIAGRVAISRCSPRDLVGLGRSLNDVATMQTLIADRPALDDYAARLIAVAPSLDELSTTLQQACVDSPPAHMREGGLIRDGYDAELDGYRGLQRDSNTWLAEYQRELTEQTRISSLKVGYNKVFGYYIEVTHAHAEKVPDTFTRKQTLKNAERYITPELKDYENKVLSAESKAIAREQALFERLCGEIANRLMELHEFGSVVADLDVLACFARRAVRYRYVQPTIVDEPVLHIHEGRHPVLDELLADRFVPNDVALGTGEASETPDECFTLGLITGPNMSGKSTYIRQTALLTLLAHTGSFIPAASATIGLTDRIFTRIGASDELHAGQSTFMVEMIETANICHHATAASLVILDEIGRGTSTYDGLALAWAITEHLAGRRCRTLFATHYHELTELGERYDNVVNLNVTVREWADQVVFLHRIERGGTDRSYGIHVAKIAGLPDGVIERARALITQLETHTHGLRQTAACDDADEAAAASRSQLSLFTEYIEHPAMQKLRGVDINALSPMDAFDLLRQLKDEMDKSNGN